jgi:hypothetical protein
MMGKFLLIPSMASRIKTESSGETTAFTTDGKLVMNFGNPHVAWGFSVKRLEEWLITLEEAMSVMPACHSRSIETLYFSLKAAHKRHLQEHEAVISEAPTNDDLMAYLTSYAAAMTWEAMEGRK